MVSYSVGHFYDNDSDTSDENEPSDHYVTFGKIIQKDNLTKKGLFDANGTNVKSNNDKNSGGSGGDGSGGDGSGDGDSDSGSGGGSGGGSGSDSGDESESGFGFKSNFSRYDFDNVPITLTKGICLKRTEKFLGNDSESDSDSDSNPQQDDKFTNTFSPSPSSPSSPPSSPSSPPSSPHSTTFQPPHPTPQPLSSTFSPFPFIKQTAKRKRPTAYDHALPHSSTTSTTSQPPHFKRPKLSGLHSLRFSRTSLRPPSPFPTGSKKDLWFDSIINDADNLDDLDDLDVLTNSKPSTTCPAPTPPTQLWAEKYRPQTLNSIMGHKKIKSDLLKWVRERRTNDPRGKYLVVLLHGDPGLGKTTMAHALLNQFGYDVCEINASEGVRIYNERLFSSTDTHEKYVRSTKAFYETLERTVAGQGFSKPSAVILDEIDGGSVEQRGKDNSFVFSGAVEAVVKLIEDAEKYKKKSGKWPSYPPIICIANEAYSRSMKKLKDHALTIKFWPLQMMELHKYARMICNRENLKLKDTHFFKFVQEAKGDARRLVTLLETYALSPLRGNADQFFETTGKDNNMTIFQSTTRILYNKSDKLENNVRLFQADQDIMGLMVWENMNELFTKGVNFKECKTSTAQLPSQDEKAMLGRQLRTLNDMSEFCDTMANVDALEGSVIDVQNKIGMYGIFASMVVGTVMTSRKKRHYLADKRPSIKFTDYFRKRKEIMDSNTRIQHVKPILKLLKKGDVLDTVTCLKRMSCAGERNKRSQREWEGVKSELGWTKIMYDNVLGVVSFP